MSFCGICCSQLKGRTTPRNTEGIYAEALFIALNYKNSNPKAVLNCTYNDIELVKKFIEPLKYFKDTTTVDDSDKKLVTKERLISETKAIFDRLNKRTENKIQLLVHYAGHGSQVTDTEKKEKDGKNESWVLSDGDMTDNEILDLFGRYIVNEKFEIYIVSDSCHSGTILDLDTLDKSKKVNKIVCISGCQDEQVSTEVGTISGGNGILTKMYIEEISSKSQQNLNKLIKGIDSRMRKAIDNQYPELQTNCDKETTNWII